MARLVVTVGDRPQSEFMGVLLVTFLAAIATVPVVVLAMGMVDEYWIIVVTRLEIERFLSPQWRVQSNRRPTGSAYDMPHRLPDRFAIDRAVLGRVAELLARAADRTDRSVPGLARPQPVATLLRGAADVLAEFLCSPRSTTRRTTPEIDELLQTLAVILVGPWRGAPYDELDRQIDGFDPNGRPAARLPGLGERTLTRYARRVADAVDTSHRVAVAVFGFASLASIVYLALARP